MIEVRDKETLKQHVIQEISNLHISASAEVKVELAEKDDHVNIVLTVYQRRPDGELKATDRGLRFPQRCFRNSSGLSSHWVLS